MRRQRLIHLFCALTLGLGLAAVPSIAAGAQDGGEGGSPSTTQLDLEGSAEADPAAPADTTTTTQLDVGASAPADDATPPNRVDAGAGGTASDASTPLALIALAGGLVVVMAAAARKMQTR